MLYALSSTGTDFVSEPIVIGIGNAFRGDDGVGWAVVDVLQKALPKGVITKKIDGSIFELIDLFSTHSNVYVVDACVSTMPPGSWRRIDATCEPMPKEFAITSSHGLGLAQAIELCRALGQIPTQLALYLIAGSSFSINDRLSITVADAVPIVSKNLAQELKNSCMKEPFSMIS